VFFERTAFGVWGCVFVGATVHRGRLAVPSPPRRADWRMFALLLLWFFASLCRDVLPFEFFVCQTCHAACLCGFFPFSCFNVLLFVDSSRVLGSRRQVFFAPLLYVRAVIFCFPVPRGLALCNDFTFLKAVRMSFVHKVAAITALLPDTSWSSLDFLARIGSRFLRSIVYPHPSGVPLFFWFLFFPIPLFLHARFEYCLVADLHA